MKLRKKESEGIAVDMSPMIDMVFLLLIFFIVASQIIDEKKPVEIPSAVYAKVPEDETGRFELTVTTAGDLFVRNDPVSLDELKTRLEPELEFNPKLRVVIRADENLKYKVTEELMAACAEVGATDLIFAAFEN